MITIARETHGKLCYCVPMTNMITVPLSVFGVGCLMGGPIFGMILLMALAVLGVMLIGIV